VKFLRFFLRREIRGKTGEIGEKIIEKRGGAHPPAPATPALVTDPSASSRRTNTRIFVTITDLIDLKTVPAWKINTVRMRLRRLR
jgi:hypothetical protein